MTVLIFDRPKPLDLPVKLDAQAFGACWGLYNALRDASTQVPELRPMWLRVEEANEETLQVWIKAGQPEPYYDLGSDITLDEWEALAEAREEALRWLETAPDSRAREAILWALDGWYQAIEEPTRLTEARTRL